MREALQLFHGGDLPTALLIDGRGYIRWHAVGLPSEEAEVAFSDVFRRVWRETAGGR